jgi:tRNA1Val (adenine37-N6)-methyltransferase
MSLTMREFSPATIDSISFHNKAVEVIQKKAGYRFAIDAILLADFVKIKANDKNIIDIGTGSGIIALLLAKCFHYIKITGIELQKGLFELAKENVRSNRLEAQVHIENIAIKDIKKRFKAEDFDSVVTNPPYRRFKSGRINPTEEKAIARHEIKTSLEEIIRISSYLLKAKGSLFLIHLPERLPELIYLLKEYKIEPKRMRLVYSREGEDAVFVLMEGIKAGREGLKIERPLYIYNKSGDYTGEVKRIYGEK